MIASWIAALAFLYLGLKEGYEWHYDQEQENEVTSTNVESAWKLAIPMTLNNVAGGVAGGLAGTDPLVMFMAAFLASYGLMSLGYFLGSYTSNGYSDKKECDPRLASSCIFIIIGIFQLI